jgi:hypothetical protein
MFEFEGTDPVSGYESCRDERSGSYQGKIVVQSFGMPRLLRETAYKVLQPFPNSNHDSKQMYSYLHFDTPFIQASYVANTLVQFNAFRHDLRQQLF